MRKKYLYTACVVLTFVALGLKPAFCQVEKQVEKKVEKKEAVNMEAQRKQIIELANKGFAAEAIKLGEEYLKIDTINIEVYMAMVDSYVRLNNLAQAEAMAKKAVSVDPKNTWVIKTLAVVYRMEGEKAQVAGEKEKLFTLAQAEIEKALTAEPENPFNNTEAAIIYFMQGKKDEAAKLIKKAVAAQPNDKYIAAAKKMIVDTP